MPSSVDVIGHFCFDNSEYLRNLTFESNSKLSTIGEWAFGYCSSLRSACIPAAVEIISKFASIGCHSLGNLVFEQNSRLNQIGLGAFAFCPALKSMRILSSVERHIISLWDGIDLGRKHCFVDLSVG
jgi:hypothetical protein